MPEGLVPSPGRGERPRRFWESTVEKAATITNKRFVVLTAIVVLILPAAVGTLAAAPLLVLVQAPPIELRTPDERERERERNARQHRDSDGYGYGQDDRWRREQRTRGEGCTAVTVERDDGSITTVKRC
jgi:hypothetical protein